MHYRCKGVVDYVELCDCPYCDGHDKRWKLDRLVVADSPRHAAETIRDDWRDYPVNINRPPDIEDLLNFLDIAEESEERKMIAMGQPMLILGGEQP